MHTFVICAYGASEYLRDCIVSLKNQSYKSKILLATSTENHHITSLCEEFSIPYFVNPDGGSITKDWNFALTLSESKYTTLAHQDDIYGKDFAKESVKALESSKHPLISFTDYYEIRGMEETYQNKNLLIKNILLSPLRIKPLKNSRFVKRRVLSLGDPICCPSVTYCMENLPTPLFSEGFRSCEDWECWEKLSKLKGDFLYINKHLCGHRIHEGSETSAIIRDGKRQDENLIMFNKFWPAPVASFLNNLYKASEDTNRKV